MALTIGGKRIGGAGPAQPLTPVEQRLADRVALALRTIQKVMNPEAYAQAIRALDPDLLERLLAEINIEGISTLLDDTLRGIVMQGSTAEARRIIRDTPRLQPPVGSGLEYTGPVTESGIILPAAQTPPPPDIEFAIEQPVDRMFRVIDTRARDYAQFRSAQLVQEVTDSNRLAIRRVVAQAFTGPTPKTVDQTARTLRQVVGLHTRWANAVQRFDDENVARLIKGGMSVDEARAKQDILTKRYRDKLIRRRAEMIARTEIQTAQNYAREASWDALNRTGLIDGRAMKRWVTAPAASRYGPPCPECAEQAGREVPWNGTFSNGRSMPPAHPHCFIAGTIVDGPIVIGSSARWYEGEAIQLTLSEGTVLTGTPNHPILTPQGWIPLGELDKGAQVIRCVDRERTAAAVDPHDDEHPSRIENVIEAFTGSSGVASRQVPVAAPDFHGDGAGSDVAVVATDGLLWNAGVSQFGEPLCQHGFGGAAVAGPSLNPGGDLLSVSVGLPSASNSGVRSGDVAPILIDGAGRHHESVSVYGPTGLDSCFKKATADGWTANVQAVGDTLLGFSGEVSVDDVVSVQRLAVAAHVYNLETVDGWYTANGVIVHNCRCTAVIVPPSRGLTGLPSQDLSSWLDRLDELEAEG